LYKLLAGTVVGIFYINRIILKCVRKYDIILQIYFYCWYEVLKYCWHLIIVTLERQIMRVLHRTTHMLYKIKLVVNGPIFICNLHFSWMPDIYSFVPGLFCVYFSQFLCPESQCQLLSVWNEHMGLYSDFGLTVRAEVTESLLKSKPWRMWEWSMIVTSAVTYSVFVLKLKEGLGEDINLY
jgi:hypothetical protein